MQFIYHELYYTYNKLLLKYIIYFKKDKASQLCLTCFPLNKDRFTSKEKGKRTLFHWWLFLNLQVEF
jgi:hypothetical protein